VLSVVSFLDQLNGSRLGAYVNLLHTIMHFNTLFFIVTSPILRASLEILALAAIRYSPCDFSRLGPQASACWLGHSRDRVNDAIAAERMISSLHSPPFAHRPAYHRHIV